RWLKASRNWRRETGWSGAMARCPFIPIGAWSSSPTRGWILQRRKKSSSGCLDSSTILHYAAEASPARLKAFSVSFQGRSFDETRFFREVSGRYQTDHHEFDLN